MEFHADALVLGATGLVGSEVLRLLLNRESCQRVVVLARGSAPQQHAKLQWVQTDLSEMARFKDLFKARQVYCCLGTTLKKAGSRQAFRKVDFEFCYEAARLAKAEGCPHFLLVSAINADVKGLSFYARTKGALENAVKELDFPKLTIARPSLLSGNRPEFRAAEEWGNRILGGITPLFRRWQPPWLPVEARAVASGLVAAGETPHNERIKYLYYQDFTAAISSKSQESHL